MILGLGMLTLMAGGRPTHTVPVAAHAPQAPVGRPECPGERGKRGVQFILIDSAGQTDTVTTVPLSEPITNIPEFHDCQDFILPDSAGRGEGLHYDSLYGIFAAFNLRARFDAALRGSLKDSATIMPGQRVPVVAAATIFSGSLRPYDPLGIRPGFNCLFLYHARPTDNAWSARMVPLKIPKADCRRREIDLSVGTSLEVRATSSARFTKVDYPPVARWDWDAERREQYIGIMCGNAWCEVGRPGFIASPAINFTIVFPVIPQIALATVPERARVTTVKGWYDRQLLALPGPNGLQPSGVIGFVVPNPALQRVPGLSVTASGPSSTVYDKRWVNVGAAVVTADYKDLRAGVNMLYFCLSSVRLCGDTVSNPRTPSMWTPISSCNDGQITWWGKLVPAGGGAPGYGCIAVSDHAADLAAWVASGDVNWTVALPATARWHWLTNDELAGWYGCQSASCCKT